jgi:glucosamine--fructose-6-phosphate aminotransferase (isomerizing)
LRFALDDQIAAQPEAVARIVSREMPRLDASRPVVFTGIGTSLHAARVAAAWTWLVSGGRVRATAVDAHHLALCYPLTADDQVVVISHRGYKRYPQAALAKAKAAGATAIAIVGADAPTRMPTPPCAPARMRRPARSPCPTCRHWPRSPGWWPA